MTAAPFSTTDLPFVRHFLRWWRGLFAPGDLIILFILGLLLLMPALALHAASWPLMLNTILPVLFLSVLLGFMLARSQYDELIALILSTVYGLCIVFLIAAINEPGDLGEGVGSIVTRTVNWFYAAMTGGINQDDLVFTLLVAVLFWYLGYNAVWHIFRIDRVWRVVLPPGLILATNLIFYNGDAQLDIYLVIFVFLALILIARSNLDAREWDWYVNGIRVPRQLRRQFIRTGAILALVAVLAAWIVPSGDIQERLDNFQKFLQSDPLQQMGEFWNRLFSPLESEGPPTTDYYGSDTLNLGGAIRLGNQTVMLVEAPINGPRYYWRSRVFERYDQGQWAPSALMRVPDFSEPIEIASGPDALGQQSRIAVEQIFTMGIRSRLIYTAPQPLSIATTGRIDLRYIDEPANTLMNVSVIRPERVIDRGEGYTAVSHMSVASAYDLRAAGTSYPDWVINPNLYVGVVSPRVLNLAQQIISEANATNPYDQAKAIETWLRTNITYNEAIPSPPEGVDPLEWLLFDNREGYCTYYSTAMIVMLRSLNIPARMAAGFAQGEYDAENNQFVVRERDAHTWVEVYFPGYGWVEFEPTAAQARLDRDGDDVTEPADQNAQPETPPSPTPTFTPQPSPTPEPTDGPQDSSIPPVPPTMTPTPSPTPTVTPYIVPTVPPPIQPRSDSVLPFLLSAVGLLLLGFLLVVLLVILLTFLWWWWEWRGMGGLSPVARAYARLERYIRLIGIKPSEQQTPSEKRRDIVNKLPQAERPVTAITRLYTIERYSGQPADPTQNARHADTADRAWPDARGQVLRKWIRRFIPWMRNEE